MTVNHRSGITVCFVFLVFVHGPCVGDLLKCLCVALVLVCFSGVDVWP